MRVLLSFVLLVLLPTALTAGDIAVTVYNSNLGVVSETRSLEFARGINRLAFADVPSQIDPASVRFELVGTGHNVTILEQNYAYDLISPDQMYVKYIDKQIELVDKEGQLYSGTLLTQAGGAIVLRESSGRIKIIQMSQITEVNFPSLPEGLITRPTLFWVYNSDHEGRLDGRVGYQTAGMNWAAEYVGVLNQDETKLDLSGWASINNSSGKTYVDAKLRLVAGDIHRARPEAARRAGRGMALAEDKLYAGFEEKAFFEYHLYTLPRKATLANREIKQIALFEPARAAVEKVFIYRPERNPSKVEVAVKFTNDAASGLGLPLPAGRTRLFKADEDGSLILLGEDNIDHTPKNEEVKVTVGYAFDIAAEERVMEQRKVSQRVIDKDIEIELRNRKDDPVTVEVEKKLYGFWDIQQSNLEFEKKDATTVIFKVPIKPDETVTVRFTVRNYLQ
ncbi:MAG: DUF4139 domain-containing protein [Candidatus Zixiibacteriota bacterium]|nr:MAG: DUF4139 domain-containing protein [candidate division Zixibacteria bacterium]